MEALRLQDGEFVRDRYEELQDARRQWVQDGTTDDSTTSDSGFSCELSVEERQELEHRRIVERVKALDAKGPTPQLNKKVLVLQDILETLYAENEADMTIVSPSNGALKRLEIDNANAPVPLKDLPTPTQVVLRMFFRTCQSLRDQSKLNANSRLSVQIANKLPSILMMMPSCVLSPGLMDEVPVQLEDGGDVSSVFYQLFQLFEELLGWKSNSSCLSTSDRTTVIVAYVALSLKWGRMGYVLKGVNLLLENASDFNGTKLEALVPFFRELAATSAEQTQVALGEEEQPCGYLMSFGKGDHGKLGHGQCVHLSCQEGNCTENKMVPTIIAATGDVLFRKIDSLSTHSIAITAKGEAMAWGNGDKFRLGHGSSTKEYTPRTIEFLSLKGRVRDLACGLGHTLALMESGDLFAWGNGSNGRLGLGDTNDRSSPTKVVIPTTSPVKEIEGGSDVHTTLVCFRHVFCGASHSMGISWDGRAYAWGKNNQGQCGHGHTNDQWTIQEIESFHDNKGEEECVTYAAGGWEHTLFCTASGRVYSCGCGYKDSRRAGIPPVLGHGDCDRRLKPSLVQALDDAREEMTKVACGWDHSLAVSAAGNVYTWGSGTNGKLGHGDEESFDIPTLVRGMEGKRVKDAKAGCEHTVFLTYDHELWTCGQGDSGRLGHGDSQTRKRPTRVELFAESGLKPVALAVGDKYNLVLVRDSDTQFEQEGKSELASTQKAPQRISGERIKHAATGVHHGRHRIGQRKKNHEHHEIKFGSNWVLSTAVQADPTGATTVDPDSASGAALFIAGHVDRLASDYLSDESDIYIDKQQEAMPVTTNLMAQQSILLPFAADTSHESLSALLQLLRWTSSTEMKEKTVRSEKNADFAGGSSLGSQERMALTLSCLRILQLNLKKSLNVSHSGMANPSSVSVDLFKQIHAVLDSLAGLKVGDPVTQSKCSSSLSAIESAISHEAAYALKMGFGLFYPTGNSRCSLLWEILNECKVHSPSMRTIFLSDQLCKDSIMMEIFRSLPSHGLLTAQNEATEDAHKERPTGKDIFDVQDLMIALLKRSSAEAVKNLDNESFADFTHEPDCFLRLLHVLQMHYFSITHRCGMRTSQVMGTGDSKDSPSQLMMNSLLKYVDALMDESLIVLKKLHKGSRQHEEIITWRLNGSFFHTLLPSAIECLSILLQPAGIQSNVVSYATDNLLLVERILPNLHVMLKMLDEVSWKMHSAVDTGNQAHDDTAPSYQLACTDQGRNWFVDLGNVCAVLCGKLCCELFHPTNQEPGDISQRGSYETQVVSEGRFFRVNHVSCVVKPGSISKILEWERVGVFEVEDELVGCESDPGAGDLRGEKQRFLLQLCDEDNSNKAASFWAWVVGKLSAVAKFTDEEQRLKLLAMCVASWHLDLSAELHSVYNIYDQDSTAADSIELCGGIWKVVSILIQEGSKMYWTSRSISSDSIEKATKTSQLLLILEPNPALVPAILRGDQHKPPIWECTGSSLSDMLAFLTKPLDISSIQSLLDVKEVNAALLRTGMCILHDLLRRLTTSSTKCCLLDEFADLTCAVKRANMTLKQGFILRETSDQHIDKAIENLFIRLARIVSSADASFELKKKALMIWTVPISATKRGVPSVVDLIAKSGIMSTLVELLLDEANVLDAHSDLNVKQPVTVEARLSTKMAPVKALLFDQTCVQVISVLAWEAFSATAVQLSKSDRFVEHGSNILLRSAGLSFHEREPLTPRNASMSPRRRLTLPKKMVISSIDEIIEQMVDGLYLMLKGAKDRLTVLDMSLREYEMLVRSVEKSGKTDSQVFLFGSPIQTSHPSTHDIAVPKANDAENNTSLTLMFWIFVEHTGVVVSKETIGEIHSKDSSVRIVAFTSHSSNSTDPTDIGRDASFTVFTPDVYPDHVSIGVSMKFDGDESWRSIHVNGQLPRGKWVQLVFGFHEEGPEHFQIFMGAKQATVNNGQQSGDLCKSFSLEFLRKATSWTRMTVGGNSDIDTLSKAPETSRLSVLPRKSPHGFAAVLDDVVITREVVTEEALARMQQNGPVLFRLKQQHLAENHCVNVLRLLCQIVDSQGPSSGVSSVLLPSSDRWITLFTQILLTSCLEHGLAQVYLCCLLQNVLPRAVPPPGLDVNTLGHILFGAHQIKTNVEELFVDLNGQSRLPSTSTIRRQNECLYRMMQQLGMLNGKHRGRTLSDNGQSSEDALVLKRTASLRCAAAIQLFQKLCNSPLWRSQMDQFIGSARTIFQREEALKSVIQSGENTAFEPSNVAAVVSTLAGYSEEVVNGHRASVQEAAIPPTELQACVPPFASVVHLDESSANQVAAIQSLCTTMLTEVAQQVLFLPARKDILERCHNDVAAVNAFDRRIGDVAHQRTRVLRVVMTNLLREKNTATANTWHHLLLGDAAVCANLLRIASSNTKECILSLLGPDAKNAMKLRRLRLVVKKLLGGSKHRNHALSPVSVAELESLQWQLWEEAETGMSSAARTPWWQQSSENRGKLVLEVVGGDVELSDLKVKALEHFPTVRLAQANICANSGLWYFEVVVLTDGLMQIGYIEGDFVADPLQGQGVGDHANSWAFDGFRCKKWNVNSYDYGEQWKTGDVVGVLLDTERLEISYFLNGKCLGVAFSGISITAASRMCPAASLNVHQSAEFNFGTLPTTSSIEEASNVGGFKHFPALDNDDQIRLRPIVMALHIINTDGTANVDTVEKQKKNGASEDWTSSSGDSDTDGEITLEGSDSLPGFARDGREIRTADPKYEESDQRRRDLVEGLTGLGFPLEWATQCATEARLPMDETSAVAWILEQMEKVELDGRASRLPGSVSVDDDGVECPSLPVALLRARMQLPNLATSQSADELPGTEIPAPAEALDIPDNEPLDNQISKISTIYQPSASVPDQQFAMAINAFIEADKDVQQTDDTTSEAFQTGHFWKQTNLLSELDALSDGVDDLLPLRIVVDTALFVAYTREILTTLLLMSLREQEQAAAYEMIRPFLASEESSACLHRFIRIVIGLEAADATFCIYAKVDSGRSLELQKAVAALLRYEVRLDSCSTKESSPLLRSFFQEMMSHCERGMNFSRGKPAVKSDSMSAQVAAAWFSWVSGVVISFVEEQVSSSEGKEGTRLPDFVVASFSSTEFLEKLVAIASMSSSAKAWKYVAFRLIARLLYGLKADERSPAFYASAQLPHLTEFLALRCRGEMHSKAFFSDVTTALFALLTHSYAALSRGFDRRYSEKQHASLRVNSYSPTNVTISWDQAPKVDDFIDESTDSTAVTDSAVAFLHVTRVGSHFPGSQGSFNNALKALPLKGTFTIRNLLPDTQYLIRVSPSQSADEVSSDTLADTNNLQGAHVLVQTPPEPVFELDNDTMGKNLVVLNRNLTAKNTVNKKWHSVRASVAFEEGVHTWQVRLDTCVSKNIFIGVCTADACMENYIGSDAYGYGFLANKAVWHNKAKLHTYGEIFKQGDIIQVTLDCNAKTLAFSRNGEYLGIAASSMRAGMKASTANDGNFKWYPAFSMYNKDDKVTLIPPTATSTFAMKDGRPQNASTIELIEAMQDVLAYQSHLAGESGQTKLFEAAFKDFDSWRRGQILFRENALGQVIGIDRSKSATSIYGLAYGDSVFTSKGQCNVLGEYRHELWYEIDEAGSPSLFGMPTFQLASWSLTTCRDMVNSPDEYPIHRYHKSKLELELENSTIADADSSMEQQNSPSSGDEVFSFNWFVNAQTQWSKSSINPAEADTKLISDLDLTATSQASSALLLSFADISTSLLLEKNDQVGENCADNGSNQKLARIGLLLYVNRCLYNVVRLAMPRNLFATSLEMSESLEPKKLYSSSRMNNSEHNQVSPVAALLNSPHWALDDPSAFSWMPSLAARLLFSSQKEKLIEEELQQTKTASRTLDTLQEANDTDEIDTDLPVIKIGYPPLRPVPFWECSTASLKSRKTYRLHLSNKSSVFVHLSKQLAEQDGRQWRRESSQPFEAIPISQAFQVQIEKPLTDSTGGVEGEKHIQQADEDDEDQQNEQPSAKQTTHYLKIFENAVREIQSPVLPLFAPVIYPDGVAESEDRRLLQLDINLELFSPSALAYSRVQSSQLLLWYFCFGQMMGIAWRSKLLLPLQYISKLFWEELVSPAPENGCGSRDVAIRAVRDGLFSIVPSRCVALLSGRNPSLRERLSDLDVSYVARLERHATYSGSHERHHDLFWSVVNAFTAVERRMLEQFVNPERRDSVRQGEKVLDTDNSPCFVLEISDALADGRGHPDSCYPVVVPIGPRSSRLHLPAYSSAQTLRHKLLLAMTNIPFM